METSNLLHIKPDLVLPLNLAGIGQSKSFKIKAINEGWAWTQRDWLQVSNDTGIGNPEQASAEKGKLYLNDIVNKIAGFLIEFSKADINDLYE